RRVVPLPIYRQGEPMNADLILYNGNIHTMDATVPRAEAIAIAAGRVLAIGRNDEIRPLAGRAAQAVDLAGRTVTPGFTDAHLHFLSYGIGLQEIELAGIASLDEALARVAERAAITPPGQWLTGRGWDHTLWGSGAFPTRQDLDRVAPDHPVFLRRKCGHAGWANTRALELAGITADTPAPFGGAIDRDPVTGQPTGILKDAAMELIFRLFQEPSLEEATAAIKAAMPYAHRAGLVGVHTMEGAAALRAFQALHAAGELKLRVTMQIPEENLDAAIQVGLRSGFGDEWLRIGGVKIFSDGALGAATAWMLEPYEGEPENYGLAMATSEHLRAVIGKASRAGIAAFVHAIGDRANREVLDAIAEARKAETDRASFATRRAPLRHRIEHAQIVHPDDVPRFAALGVIASMQPIHATQDMLIADARWGKRSAHAYAWRSLLNAGAVLAFGSDCPVEDLDVMKGIYAAVTRRRADGTPGPAGWYGEQRLTVAEAVHAYTVGCAYASGEETLKGSLTPGKVADLVVLSQDIFARPPEAILETQVVATTIGGEWAYQQ
ncbi:MAG: amidohydrolase, partial [Anaerolineae bacterium]|nr:amidohydrolase [Anaerolineae bacterium]